MRIEGGSQNVSRIPGHYVYPRVEFRPEALSPVSPVRGGVWTRPGHPVETPLTDALYAPPGRRPEMNEGLGRRLDLMA